MVKNKLRKLKKTNDDDIMLHYLKYSHLDDIPEEDIVIVSKENKATQFPNIKNKSTQTHNKEMNDKATDTMDDLHKIDYKYYLEGNSKQTKSNEKLKGNFKQQVETVPIIDKDDLNKDKEDNDDDNFLTRNVKRGFRLAEFALNSSIATANLTMSVADTIAEATLSNNNIVDDEEASNNINENDASAEASRSIRDLEVVSVNSSPAMTVHSSAPPQTIHSSSSSGDEYQIAPPTDLPIPSSSASVASSRRSSRSRSSRISARK